MLATAVNGCLSTPCGFMKFFPGNENRMDVGFNPSGIAKLQAKDQILVTGAMERLERKRISAGGTELDGLWIQEHFVQQKKALAFPFLRKFESKGLCELPPPKWEENHWIWEGLYARAYERWNMATKRKQLRILYKKAGFDCRKEDRANFEFNM